MMRRCVRFSRVLVLMFVIAPLNEPQRPEPSRKALLARALNRSRRSARPTITFLAAAAGFRVAAVEAIQIYRSLNRDQRNTFLACFLGWTLDALDFFLLTFVVRDVSAEFSVSIVKVTFAITLTLMMRPLGALIFGLLGDRFGRRVPLMVDIIFYSLMELLTAFSPNYTVFLIFRALYGIGMGGEWGLGASLAMESLPARARGLASGILQQGYSFGFLLAAVVYWLVFPHFRLAGTFCRRVRCRRCS